MLGLGAGGDEGGDAALHVDRAAAVEQPAADLGRERIARPAVARRHHVEMAGEGEMGRAGAARREQILDRPVRRLAGDEAMDLEAERRQRLFEHVEHRAARGVTLGQAIRRAARSTGSIAAVMRDRA